jgi:hypothetical protein
MTVYIVHRRWESTPYVKREEAVMKWDWLVSHSLNAWLETLEMEEADMLSLADCKNWGSFKFQNSWRVSNGK